MTDAAGGSTQVAHALSSVAAVSTTASASISGNRDTVLELAGLANRLNQTVHLFRL